ncbi:MAG TPA: glycosyltransferase family 4 protein [Noviherbaspirillum sp.]|jgi:glycosyltransferase involved in cell wall biosynthesis|uniref:glycosyltransferase family 4 protein n=1 Tax=Noviherbaspirillum sp. TaxID=1926288 RepID=UPI002F94E41F
MLRIALISNELPPYRVPFYRTLARMPDVALQVVLCSRREPNRQWEIPPLDFGHVFLREHVITRNGRYIHNNPGVISALRRFAPDVVVTGGFNPTHLYAFAYAVARGIPHVVMTDGTDISEQGLSSLHRTVRRIVYARSRSFVAASRGGHRLFEQYRIPVARRYTSCLCVDNDEFANGAAFDDRPVDFLFCGRIEAVKNPLFALEVAIAAAERLQRRVSIMFVGAGNEEQALRDAAARHAGKVNASFRGFVSHDDLPAIYAAARIFLFPTRWDPWGVVTNEACAAGLPVLVSPEAGVAGELVIDGRNGSVAELDVGTWADHAAALLQDRRAWEEASASSISIVGRFNYESAAAGLRDACRAAVSPGRLVRGHERRGRAGGAS